MSRDYEILPLGKHLTMTHVITHTGAIKTGRCALYPEDGFYVSLDDDTELLISIDHATELGLRPAKKKKPRVAYEMEGVARSINYGHGVGIYVPDEYCGRKFKLVEIID
jgi:hypothetical protein